MKFWYLDQVLNYIIIYKIYNYLVIDTYICLLSSLDTKSELFFKHLPETILCTSGLFFDIEANVGCDTCYDNIVLVTWNLFWVNFIIKVMDMIKIELLISWEWRQGKIINILIEINYNSLVFNILLDYFLVRILLYSYVNNIYISFFEFFFFENIKFNFQEIFKLLIEHSW